ncbi:hypothetical protein [Streptomyces sp. TP-A0874]|uniref:hypothetical protein n=1 Tax=Streptomyces sp. TP-A0874 TaxID=549819 RepID=UPI000852FEAB|nr:hypothetical protein [Streptomyces sp. TP-A0874]
MSTVETIPAVVLFFTFGLVTLLMWGEAVMEWSGPPQPHDPARYFTRRRYSWEKRPEALGTWQAGGPVPDGKPRGPVQVARIVAVLDGEGSEDGGEVRARLRLRLADGDTSVIHTEVSDPVNVRPGVFLPVRPMRPGMSHVLGDTWDTAWELPAHEVGRVLLEHRRSLGLVDESGHRVLAERLTSDPELATVRAIRPTGSVRAGHVEVEVDVTIDGRAHTVRGFLRPEDIATARHTGQAPLTASTPGQWVLWPTWY